MDVDSTCWPARTGWTVIVLAVLFTFIGSSARAQESDLDALMARVLERRNETWKVLHDYVLDERERFGLAGPADVRLFGSDRQYTWYVRDGILVRSPVKVNGVAVPEADRRDYEAKWLAEEQGRAEREKKKVEAKAAEAKTKADGGTPGGAAPPQAAASPGDAPADVVAKGLEPRFVSEANFLRFPFEPGRYFLVGRDVLDGRPVLKIEYYPKKLIVDSDEPGRKPPKENPNKSAASRDADKLRYEEIGKKFNKVSMVTLWIDPAEWQIVRYDFENLGLDFFPGQWLVRVGDTSASMTMGRYFDGVWLPKAIVMTGDLQVAIGSFDIDYRREFLEYRKAETAARIRGYGDVK
ncbi:MAG: hypothetical protein ABIT71_09505 [Vicinamibacteraceae bacterium]